jgi:hypothetical protein
MSETPPPLPPAPPPREEPPNFWLLFVVGLALPFLACFLCYAFNSPWPFYIGAAIAFATVFFDDWRGVFLGALAAVGAVMLILAVWCGAFSLASGMRY